MPLQTTRHLDLRPEGDSVLLWNQMSNRRMLANDDIWDVFRAHEQPAEPQGSLAQQAAAADLIAPADRPAGVGSIEERLVFAVDKHLKDQHNLGRMELARRWPDTLSRLKEVRSLVEGTLRPPAQLPPQLETYFWRRPEGLITAFFDHAEVFLQRECGQPEGRFMPAEFIRRSNGRPRAKEEFEQQPCTLATTLDRVDYLRKLASEQPPRDTGRGKLLILGDDDLISIAMSLPPYEGWDVDTFEIDDELVGFLKPRQGPRIGLHQRDLTKGLPAEFHRQYPLVITDPMYAAEGIDWFVKCCADALEAGPHARLCYSTCPGLLEDAPRLYAEWDKVGLRVIERLPFFNRYAFPDFARRVMFMGLTDMGSPPHLLSALTDVPYLYADLFVLGWKET